MGRRFSSSSIKRHLLQKRRIPLEVSSFYKIRLRCLSEEHFVQIGKFVKEKKKKKKPYMPRPDKEVRKSEAMDHPDKLGAGAAKRKKLPKKEKVGVVMSEFKRGTLNSGSGAKVTNPKQALAIAMSESGQSRNKKKKKSH